MKEKFINHKFNAHSIEKLRHINLIIDQYDAQGYDLSLRQLYYQMVARDWIENSQRSYKQIVGLVRDGRYAGLIDWEMIKDRNRSTERNSHWESPSQILRTAARGFAIDKWKDQPWHVEVMVEKDALSGVLWPVCSKLDVRFTANKGYSSASMMKETAERVEQAASGGGDIVIIYLGDHDPSGMDMTRDIADRLELLSYGTHLQVDRIALNMDQILDLKPPENPAKMSDSRAQAYIMEFGHNSWELDALEPSMLADLVEQAVLQFRDEDLWKKAIEKEAGMQQVLIEYARKEEGIDG